MFNNVSTTGTITKKIQCEAEQTNQTIMAQI